MDANTQDDMKSQGTPCNGKVTPPDNEKPIENGDKKEKEGAQKKEEDKQKEEQKENKKKETPKIEQQIIGNAKNTKIGVINVYGAKQFNKNKNKKPVGNEIFVDPSKLLPRNPSSLSVFHSAVEINEKITRWEEERLMLLICQNQDISFSTAFQLIGNHRFETYDKRFLSFAGSNANRDDINLEMFLVHQIGRGEKLIVFIDIERRFSFFDSLFVGKMTAQSIKEQFQKKDILLICVADPQLMMQSKEQIEQKFFFVSWEIDFLPHLLRNYLPEKSSSIMEEILTQKAKGLWEEGNGNVFYDLIHRYMRENILEEEINKRKKLESNKIMTKVEKDDTFGGEIKEVKARDIFIDKEPHKTVLYTGVFFSKLTPIDFDRMVRLLLKNKTIEIEKSTQVITDDEKVKTVKTTEKKQVEELWDKEADKILKECSLQVVYADNNAQQMDFSYPYLRNDLKNLIEKEHPMYLKKQFEPIQYSGILFASNISTGITENIIRLAIHMISLNPDYYGGEWLKEFIYQVKEQYNFQYEPKDNPLEVIIQFVENNENKEIRRHFYMQISRLIREMLNYTQLKDVVKNFLNDLFANEGHDAVLHIALNVGKGMLFAPQFDFDLFYWLRRLLDQGPGDINEETYESLRKIAFERSFQVYDILETVSSWLPEKDQELESLSPSNRCALLFIVDYTSNTLEQAKTKYKEKFYGQGLTTYPLFMPLKENKNSREDKLKKIVDWLLHPLIESVLNNEKQVDPNDDDDIDFDINRYTAAVLEEWAMALLGFDNEKSNPADSQAEEILHILLSQVIITLSKDRPRFRKIIDWFAKRRIEYRDFIDEYEVEKETKIQLMAGYKTARMLSGRLKELMVEYEKGDKK